MPISPPALVILILLWELIKLLICILIEEANLLNKKPLLENILYHISSSLSIHIQARMHFRKYLTQVLSKKYK